ncbi:hypothetical protein [Aquimarina sp. 2201CG5-10]|uniref:hypothetical protein n=1 Tax=Aquimarina callyspongiae TaxID=3098150 RepID=UPI002AB5349E|nr:hypothetical protein [Aquimarina sp. 2201CG5-10]MDY8134440.1 hypothetical protein [Aquimarina sp. 2201CG5-10]
MKTIKTYLFMLSACGVLLFASCVEDLDFDQLDEVVLTPVFEADFIFSRFDTSEFEDPNLPPDTPIDVPPVRDTINYDLVGTDFAIDNLERVELTFEFRNTIETSFEFEFQFLNDSDQPVGNLYMMTANPGLGEGTEPVVTTEIIELDNATLAQLASARKLATEVRVINANSDLRGFVELRSKGTYFVNYQL